MKSSVLVLAFSALCGCSPDALERVTATGPLTVPPGITATGSAWLWGMIINANGGCIPRATVQVVRGQSAGQSVEQETPCGAWDYDGGFYFRNLVPGVAMTFRLSAPGYVDLEETVTPTLGPQMAFLFELKPASQP